jgi:hypothetical protein
LNETMNVQVDAVEEVVRGIVIPTLWDNAGNPLRLSILTADEGEYAVSPRGMGRRLFAFLAEEVKARIERRLGSDHEEVVRVLSFTVVQRSRGEVEALPTQPAGHSPAADGTEDSGDWGAA